VDQLRDGQLSEKNHSYLHGRPVEGCTLSREERQSRKRVVDGPYDPRLREEKFARATVVVPNNDAKYQINKDRARAYARDAATPLAWSVARDKAGTEALQAQACDKEAKVRWLQYHDMDTEGLCGMLPLAIGMPVALTHHVDRSEKVLLKGRVGYVHSWDWKENDQQPSVVHLSSTRIRSQTTRRQAPPPPPSPTPIPRESPARPGTSSSRAPTGCSKAPKNPGSTRSSQLLALGSWTKDGRKPC